MSIILGLPKDAGSAAVLNTAVRVILPRMDGLTAGHSSAKDTPVHGIAAASKTKADVDRVKS